MVVARVSMIYLGVYHPLPTLAVSTFDHGVWLSISLGLFLHRSGFRSFELAEMNILGMNNGGIVDYMTIDMLSNAEAL